jgi:hypothetical protein
MNRKLIIVLIAGLVTAGAGTAVGLASSGNDDVPLKGDAYERATEAALDHLGEGEVVETEAGDDGAAYGVEVRMNDGLVVEVELDNEFNVIGSEQDERPDSEESEDDD